jgi:hypothetical protein
MIPNDENEYEFVAGGKMLLLDIARAWYAFQDLRDRNAITCGFCGREMSRARNAGWDLGFRASTQEHRYLDRMSADPFDFFRGYEWGLDVFAGRTVGRLLHPREFVDFASEARVRDGQSALLVGDVEAARAVARFRTSRQAAADAKARRAQASAATCHISPFILPSVRDAILMRYGIANGEVFVRGSFGFGSGPSLSVARVTDVYADNGLIWGDIVFMNETGPVVKWRNVFRPRHTLREAQRVLKSQVTSPGESIAVRRERACPYCAESVLVQAKLCKHCGQTIEPLET